MLTIDAAKDTLVRKAMDFYYFQTEDRDAYRIAHGNQAEIERELKVWDELMRAASQYDDLTH